jgi:hypothetical protein
MCIRDSSLGREWDDTARGRWEESRSPIATVRVLGDGLVVAERGEPIFLGTFDSRAAATIAGAVSVWLGAHRTPQMAVEAFSPAAARRVRRAAALLRAEGKNVIGVRVLPARPDNWDALACVAVECADGIYTPPDRVGGRCEQAHERFKSAPTTGLERFLAQADVVNPNEWFDNDVWFIKDTLYDAAEVAFHGKKRRKGRKGGSVYSFLDCVTEVQDKAKGAFFERDRRAPLLTQEEFERFLEPFCREVEERTKWAKPQLDALSGLERLQEAQNMLLKALESGDADAIASACNQLARALDTQYAIATAEA